MKEPPLIKPDDTTRGCRPRAALTLVGGVMVHLALGAYYTFGNMAPYIVSYLRAKSGEPWIKNVDSLWISNVGVLPGPFAVFLAGVLEKRLGCRITTAIGCVIFSLSVACTFFTIKQSLALVCITYGFGVSLGGFIAYGVPIQTAARWFPNNPTLVIGIILCGYGGSTLIMNQVITGYINPENKSPDLETDDGEKYFTQTDVLNRVPNIFLILAGIYISLQIVGVALMFEPIDIPVPQEVETNYTKATREEVNKKNPESEETPDMTEITSKENINSQSQPRVPVKTVLLTMAKNRNSYVIFSLVFFVFAGMQFNISLYKAYGQTFISDDKFLALVGSIAAVFNCTFRPLWGYLMDKYGFKVTTKLLAASFVCIMTTISLTEKLGKVAFMVWICASYGSFCGIFPIGPSTMGRLFGNENMVVNMSFQFVAVSAATLFGGFSGLTLKDTIGWHGLFLTSGCLGAIAFFCTFFFNGKDKNGEEI